MKMVGTGRILNITDSEQIHDPFARLILEGLVLEFVRNYSTARCTVDT